MLGVGHRQDRAEVQSVGPDADLAGQLGEGERVGGAVAVADVDDALHAPGVA